jgi:hypothetical protein
VTIKLYGGALTPILKGKAAQGAVLEAADGIAAALGNPYSHDGPVEVDVQSHEAKLTAAASVTLDHPAGFAMEAKHGYLAKAARAAGYKVKGR